MPEPLRVPPADPRANYLAYKDEIDRAISRALASGKYILDSEVGAFEQDIRTRGHEQAPLVRTHAGRDCARGADCLRSNHLQMPLKVF